MSFISIDLHNSETDLFNISFISKGLAICQPDTLYYIFTVIINSSAYGNHFNVADKVVGNFFPQS